MTETVVVRLYQQERAIQELADLICEVMEKQGVSKEELASRAGHSETYLTWCLEGGISDLRPITDVFTALDVSLHFRVEPLEA